MWRILSLLPDSLTEWVALALVAGMAFLAGFGRGADDARQECEARIAVMEKDRARQEQARAEAMAAAEKQWRLGMLWPVLSLGKSGVKPSAV